MKRILFVCHGNICRSPMAEFIFKRLVRRAGLEEQFEVASAATSNEEVGNPVYPMAKRTLAEHGIGCPGKTSRQITAHFFGGDPDGKLSLLLSHVDPSDEERHGRDVADPWYTRKFNIAYDDITAGCTALFEKLTIES